MKELRTRGFLGVTEARLTFGQTRGVSIQTAEGDFPGTVSAAEFALEALDWVLFGRLQPGRATGMECSAELEFDRFAVHRKTIPEPPGIVLRFFKYSSNPYACVATVKDLTAKTLEETQVGIANAIGITDISGLRHLDDGSAEK